jgi:hypothetical protein
MALLYGGRAADINAWRSTGLCNLTKTPNRKQESISSTQDISDIKELENDD